MMETSGVSLRARPSALSAVVDKDMERVRLFAMAHGQLPRFAHSF